MNEQVNDPATNSVYSWASYFPSLYLNFSISKRIDITCFIPAKVCYKGLKVVLTVSRWDPVKSAVRQGAVYEHGGPGRRSHVLQPQL